MFSKITNLFIVFCLLLTKAVIWVPAVSGQSYIDILSEKEYSLSDRYSNTYVNNVFSDNILLTLAYMSGAAKENQDVDWGKVKGDFVYSLKLDPNETFAFHDIVLPEYSNAKIETTNAHFNSSEGFESDGWLVADGVCHLASFINVVARDAGLNVVSPTRHDFAVIPDVPKDYGVAIYYMPTSKESSSLQNLYITNTFNTSILFVFTHKGDNLDIKVVKS